MHELEELQQPDQMPTVEVAIDKIQPTYDRILIRRVEAQKLTKGGIIIPEAALQSNRPIEGIVIAVGQGRLISGQIPLQPLILQQGDRVLFAQNGACLEILIVNPVTNLAEPYLLIPESNVLSKIVAVANDPVARLLALTVKMHPVLAKNILDQLEGVDVSQFVEAPIEEPLPEEAPFVPDSSSRGQNHIPEGDEGLVPSND